MSRDALVVGINIYDHMENLLTPASDAEAIAEVLETRGGFTVVRRLPEVVDSTSKIQINPKGKVTVEQLKAALIQLFNPKSKQVPETVLFYFSGHGLRISEGFETAYLATSECSLRLGIGLEIDWLRKQLLHSPVRNLIVWLDCCHSGELLNFQQMNIGTRLGQGSICFITASRDFEPAYEKGSHSELTTQLLEGLNPKNLSNYKVNNLQLSAHISSSMEGATQRPLFFNCGEPILLTSQNANINIDPTITPSQPICPYKGLRYFDFNDEDPKYFFGRTALVDEMLEKVRVGNFLAVLGPSGSGKSSAVRAGLLHQLKLGQRISGSSQWDIRVFQPGDNPLRKLASELTNPHLLKEDWSDQFTNVQELLRTQGAEGLKQLVLSLDKERLVLVVDQFEESFAPCNDFQERRSFFACLLESLPLLGQRICLVLTMRADFLGKCLEHEYSGLAGYLEKNLVGVTSMGEKELRQAIEQPAHLTSLKIEPGLTDEIVRDVLKAPASLPLMQDALEQLWKHKINDQLLLKTYASLGGIEGMLRNRADKVYEDLSAIETAQKVARHIFLALTQPGEGTEDTRRHVPKSDLASQFFGKPLIDQVVQKLADEKLIVTGTSNRNSLVSQVAEVVDIAHESLIRHWPLLKGWIDEKRKDTLQIRKLDARAKDWEEANRLEDYLLIGSNLQESIKLQEKQEILEIYFSDLMNEFIAASRRNWCLEKLKSHKELGEDELDAVRAELDNSDLSGANLSGANLSGANLSGANLSGANLSGANLSDTTLSAIDLNNANLTRTQFYRADLTGATLGEAMLTMATLIGARLKHTNLRNSDLSHSHLIGADLSGANLSGANLSGANLNQTNLSGADLSGADLSQAKLSQANLREVIVTNKTQLDAKWRMVWELQNQAGSAQDLSGVDLSQANLNRANLNRANLNRANLNRANLSSADLSGADLSSADLSGADLNGAILSGTILSGADLNGAILSGIKELTVEQVKSARNWHIAQFDPEFQISIDL
jgi:uncharacterized protein YjbI with pentapeptide repeats